MLWYYQREAVIVIDSWFYTGLVRTTYIVINIDIVCRH